MKRVFQYFFLSVLVVLVPGCGRILDWGKGSFYQGELRKDDYTQVNSYIRSVAIYDQFTTRGIFDAIWLSDPVRTVYSELHSSRRGTAEEYKKTFLRRQLEENNHFLSFYVLSLYEVPLGEPESEWSVFLEVDGQLYLPMEIKAVDVPYEYRVFFDRKYTAFKTSYAVRFNAMTVEEKPIITPEVRHVALHFRGIDREAILKWDFDESGNITKPQKYYGVGDSKKSATSGGK